jgi:enamine deaminase RidA (YjgF/YER057c/UK114 family)
MLSIQLLPLPMEIFMKNQSLLPLAVASLVTCGTSTAATPQVGEPGQQSVPTMATQPQFFATPGYGDRQLKEMYYSQAVKIGDRVETSGQGGWSDDWKFPESIEDEIAQAFRNVERTLKTTGATWNDVVSVDSYHVGGFGPGVNETMVKEFRHYMPDHAPIWTETGVSSLGDPTMRVEIRVTAIVPSSLHKP